jgi:hypothetical protein
LPSGGAPSVQSMDDRRTCILVELTDGTARAYEFPDEQSAATWYAECRSEWNAGRTVVFTLRPAHRFSPTSAMHRGDDVAHLELTTADAATARGVECSPAVILG